MKKPVLFLLLSLFVLRGFSQNGEIMVEGTAPNLYVEHTVQPKENWYSIGRLYNANPKELAPYNGLTLASPLSIGQQLKVPLNNSNLAKEGVKAADEVLVPLYYTVREKEWMYRISVNHAVSPQDIEKWNGINNGQIKAGMKLIIGYLKVKHGQSALAAGGFSRPAAKPVTHEPAAGDQNKTVVAEVPRTATAPVVKNEAPKETAKPVTPVSTPSRPTATANGGVGYFRSSYEETGKRASGAAGVFKSTSGWNDGKYYALMNNVPVGTIVKVTNPASGKMVYAKILGGLPDMKESLGLAMRISDAAAAELGATESGKFGVDVTY